MTAEPRVPILCVRLLPGAGAGPETVKNFAGLACGAKEWIDPETKQKMKKPLSNGTIFHRVTPGYSFADEIHPDLKFGPHAPVIRRSVRTQRLPSPQPGAPEAK